MDKLLQYLEEYQPTPQYAQIATGGNWEEAIRIYFGKVNASELPQIKVDSSIAGEIFYKLSDGRMIFVGLRYSPGLDFAPTPKDFLVKLKQVFVTAPGISLRELLNSLGKALNNNPSTFMLPAVDYVELGVEGYWKSVGSKVLRKRGEQALTEESLVVLLSQNQALLQNDKNHTALEFAFINPEHWIGVQTSTFNNKKYVTDLRALIQLSNII